MENSRKETMRRAVLAIYSGLGVFCGLMAARDMLLVRGKMWVALCVVTAASALYISIRTAVLAVGK